MITRTQVDGANAAVRESQKAANSVKEAYIDENSAFKEGDQVILFKNKMIGTELTETIVGQVEIAKIEYEQYETLNPAGLRFWFNSLNPDTGNKKEMSFDYDRMQLASEFLGQLEYDIPTAESVAQELEQNEDQEDEKD